MRPRRLYIDSETQKPYYIINKKKVYIKVPKGISLKQLQKVNIKNIIQLPTRRRVKRKSKRTKASFDKKITGSMVKGTEISSPFGFLPTYLFQEKKEIPELSLAGRKKPEPVLIPSAVKIPMAVLVEDEKTPVLDFKFTPMKPEPEFPKSGIKGKTGTSEKPIEIGKKITGANIYNIVKQFVNEYKGEHSFKNFLIWFNSDKIQNQTLGGVKNIDRRPTPFLMTYFNDAIRLKKREDEGENIESDIETAFSGSGLETDGLYNDQIERIAKKRLKHFVPCIPADKTDDLMKYVARGDKEFAFVINTNPSDSNGSGDDGYRPGHWTCVYIDNRDDYPSCEFFDPLAEGLPPKPVIDIMRRIAKKMNPEKMFKYKQNLIRRQSFKTSNCGQHCIKFIEDRMNGDSFCEASGYDDFIAKHKGADDSEHGENDLQKVLPKYNSYI